MLIVDLIGLGWFVVMLVVVCSLLFGCVCLCFDCFWVLWWMAVAFVVRYVLLGGCVLVANCVVWVCVYAVCLCGWFGYLVFVV